MKIRHVEKIQGTPVVGLCVDAWKHLQDCGFTEDMIPFDWEQCAFWAEEEGEVIGILVYKEQAWDHSLFVAMGYVKPENRGKGVYRSLWEKAVAHAKEKQLRCITGIVHWQNKEMQAVMERFGRLPVAITYDYRLEVKEEDG